MRHENLHKNEVLWLFLHLRQSHSSFTKNEYCFVWIQRKTWSLHTCQACTTHSSTELQTWFRFHIDTAAVTHLPLWVEEEIFMQLPIRQGDDDTCCPVSCSETAETSCLSWTPGPHHHHRDLSLTLYPQGTPQRPLAYSVLLGHSRRDPLTCPVPLGHPYTSLRFYLFLSSITETEHYENH